MDRRFDAAAYGGAGWRPRTASALDDIGTLWTACGQDSEWRRLKAVLVHRPGPEIQAAAAGDPDASQMLERPDPDRLRDQHDALAGAYRKLGVVVQHVDPQCPPPPNAMFVADLMFMTPAGAIVGRPASTVRAGEERWVAARLGALGIPILRTVTGGGTFEGADAMWLDGHTALVGVGLRTNRDGAEQVASTLRELGAAAMLVDLPYGTMHLMGQVRIVDEDLAFVWPGRIAFAAVTALRARGCTVRNFPDEQEATRGFAHNFVTVGPREILMPEGCQVSEAAYRRAGVVCHTVAVGELLKAAGGIGCLTGVLERESGPISR